MSESARSVLPRPKHLKREFSAVAKQARAAEGLSQGEIAKTVGTDQPRASRWENATDPHVPSVLEVAAGPTKWARRIIGWQGAHHGLSVIPQPEVQHGDNHLLRVALVTAECGGLPRQLSLALAEGLTDAGVETVLHAAQAASDSALETVQWASATLRARRRPK